MSVYIDGDIPEYGEKVLLYGPFRRIEPAQNDGEWDAASYYRSFCVLARAGGYRIASNVDSGTNLNDRIRRLIVKLRVRTTETLRKIYPDESFGIAEGLLCGVKDDLDDEVYDRYRDLGLAHILAVSGMHVAALGGALTALFSCFLERKPAGIAAAAILLLYGLLTGFGVACVRAVMMYLFSALGRAVGRTTDRLTAITFLMAVMVVRRPTVVLQTGFVLTFFCAYLLCFLARMKEHRSESRYTGVYPGVRARITAAFCTLTEYHALFILLILPVQLFFFFKTSPYSIAINTIAIPLIGIVFVVAVFGVIAGYISTGLGSFVSGLSHYGIVLLNRLTKLFRSIPGSVVVTGRPAWWNCFLYAALLCGALYLFHRRSRSFVLIAAFAFAVFLPLPSGTLRITNLSVGQGDCSVIVRGGKCIVIDCGSTGRKDVGERVLQQYLWYHGIAAPDAVFFTHSDADHVNGLTELLCGEWSETPVYFPCAEEDGEYVNELRDGGVKTLTPLAQGDVVSVDCGIFGGGKLHFTVLSPRNGASSEDRNETSLILAMSTDEISALFLADADAETLSTLAREYAEAVRTAAYVKIAHHGSRYSLSEEFYALLSPAVSVISVGENKYGHPSGEVIEALRKTGSSVYITKENGQVSCAFSENDATVRCFSVTRANSVDFSTK
ncbi:MAG: DNA internalization-related competence protein ComEC/Rec2 [Lachnospiraceae bacterium]|nr:DNA internalization-related competence protein ComEC/Rec2 [Lachnospiraceae bacterium]